MNATGIIHIPIEPAENIYLRVQKQTPFLATTYLYNTETNQKMDNLSDITIFNMTKNFYIQRVPKYKYYGIYLDNDYMISYKNSEIAIIKSS
jgi:hypothetical protein